MVDSFVRVEPDSFKSFRDELFLAPVDVPIIIFGLSIVPFFHCLKDAVGEERFVLYFGTELVEVVLMERIMLLFDVLSKVL